MFAGLAFMAPWVLVGLISLPVLWWVLRLLPPSPKQVAFAPLRLLRGLHIDRISPAHMPLWLLLLRMAMLALIIIALAEPVRDPKPDDQRTGPILMILDDGWASAPDWPDRLSFLRSWIDHAARHGRSVILTGTTPETISLENLDPDTARHRLAAWQPAPVMTTHDGLTDRIDHLLADHPDALKDVSILWAGDHLASPGSDRLMNLLVGLGPVSIRTGPGPVILRAPAISNNGITLKAEHLRGQDQDISMRVLAHDGRLLGEQPLHMPAADATADVNLDLPTQWRNQAARVEVTNRPGAGSVWLLDDRLQRQPVTVIGDPRTSQSQPLLSANFYLEQALKPFADVTIRPLDDCLASIHDHPENQPAMIILSQGAALTPKQQADLAAWMEQGGVLVRFAGPHLNNSEDVLLPVQLRQQERQLGGALTWEKPLNLGSFPANTPFSNLTIPDDVTITRQILAEPSVDLPGKSWAVLKDGTPLVTADARGAGYLVLFHVTATPEWSNLPISGLFVDMLRQLTRISHASGGPMTAGSNTGHDDTILQPIRIMSGTGQLQPPDAQTKPISLRDTPQWHPDRAHPPGIYARPPQRIMLNIGDHVDGLVPLDIPGDVTIINADGRAEQAFKPLLLSLALLLFLTDWAISWGLRGLVARLAPACITLVMVAGIWGGGAFPAHADPSLPDSGMPEGSIINRAPDASQRPWLGYIMTGDSRIDDISQQGLDGLAMVLRNRTAADVPGGMPVDPDQDDLAFFPLIYWPITGSQPPLSDQAVRHINDYLAHGGMIVFDTRDENQASPGNWGPGVAQLRMLARGLDIPPLKPVDSGHVLSKSFYLLHDFPGLYNGGTLWVEAADTRQHDGVAGIVVTSNDLAAAWAVNTAGQPLVPMGSGGERQREMARRVGVNLVMYVLTGNYKADQVHVPFILERLGQ